MGDLFSTKTNAQTTTNQQVGVSGTGAAGLSGTVGGSQAANNSNAFGNLTAGPGGNIQIVSSDLAALQANLDVSQSALNANASATAGADEVANNAVNANTQATLAALQGGVAAFHDAAATNLAALAANQAVSQDATNAGLQTSIHSLDLVQTTEQNAAQLIAAIQAGANQVALQAAPVSAGDIVNTLTATLKPVLIGEAVIFAVYLLLKSSK